MYGTEEVQTYCPYCGETITLVVDCSADSEVYIEDCQVCCRPIEITLHISTGGTPEIALQTDSE